MLLPTIEWWGELDYYKLEAKKKNANMPCMSSMAIVNPYIPMIIIHSDTPNVTTPPIQRTKLMMILTHAISRRVMIPVIMRAQWTSITMKHSPSMRATKFLKCNDTPHISFLFLCVC
jgi:hypothetical protein